ncbi:MAG: metallophosphoesterase [Anaerovoracaceae bacterium]
MIALLLLPIYIALGAYVYKFSLRWIKACHGFFHSKPFKVTYFTVFFVMLLSPGIAFLMPKNKLGRIAQIISDYWIGIFAITLVLILILHLIKFIATKTGKISKEKWRRRKYLAITGTLVFLLTISFSALGIYQSKAIVETNYNVSINKNTSIDDLNIVLIADLHMGYNIGVKSLTKIVNKINNMDPDLVCIAGDIFNNNYDALENDKKMIEILSKLKTKYGVYAAYGNHDIDEPILAGFTFSYGKNKKDRPMSDPRMDKFLEKANIKLLQDEVLSINNEFYLGGRLDREKPGRRTAVRLTEKEIMAGIDQSKPVIIIDHEPTTESFEGLSKYGTDLDLGGHTHNGQFFPLNLTAKLMWDNPAGELKIGNMTSVVTSGVGVFGPNMRLGTHSEIVNINVKFK